MTTDLRNTIYNEITTIIDGYCDSYNGTYWNKGEQEPIEFIGEDGIESTIISTNS